MDGALGEYQEHIVKVVTWMEYVSFPDAGRNRRKEINLLQVFAL